jgi:hypothetical protein
MMTFEGDAKVLLEMGLKAACIAVFPKDVMRHDYEI